MSDYAYAGKELDVFSRATNWKAYFRSHLDRYLGDEVLEVGAGIGSTTRLLHQRKRKRWVCLEPDPGLAARLKDRLVADSVPARCEIVIGSLQDHLTKELFDSVIYIDVLEHIESDRDELQRAVRHLRPGGFLIVLSPAHQWLYTNFDREIGHYRRYSRAMLRAVTPPELLERKMIYLDSVGMLASLANRVVLKESMPSARQIAFWDNVLIPLSRALDPLLFHKVGKSVLGVWQKA
jgi:2-polyprenyl-3-methyl-5-hydroxy-6-metoxy-1,4-benzoquinol methylase